MLGNQQLYIPERRSNARPVYNVYRPVWGGPSGELYGGGPAQQRPFYGGGPAQTQPSYFEVLQQDGVQQRPVRPVLKSGAPRYGGWPGQRRPSYFQAIQELNYQQNPLLPSIDPPPRYSQFRQPEPIPPMGIAPDSGQPTLSQSPQYLPGWTKRRGPDGREYWVPPATGAMPAPLTPNYKSF